MNSPPFSRLAGEDASWTPVLEVVVWRHPNADMSSDSLIIAGATLAADGRIVAWDATGDAIGHLFLSPTADLWTAVERAVAWAAGEAEKRGM